MAIPQPFLGMGINWWGSQGGNGQGTAHEWAGGHSRSSLEYRWPRKQPPRLPVGNMKGHDNGESAQRLWGTGKVKYGQGQVDTLAWEGLGKEGVPRPDSILLLTWAACPAYWRLKSTRCNHTYVRACVSPSRSVASVLQMRNQSHGVACSRPVLQTQLLLLFILPWGRH